MTLSWLGEDFLSEAEKAFLKIATEGYPPSLPVRYISTCLKFYKWFEEQWPDVHAHDHVVMKNSDPELFAWKYRRAIVISHSSFTHKGELVTVRRLFFRSRVESDYYPCYTHRTEHLYGAIRSFSWRGDGPHTDGDHSTWKGVDKVRQWEPAIMKEDARVALLPSWDVPGGIRLTL